MKNDTKEEWRKLKKLKTMHEVIPGILEKSWLEIERKIELVRPFAKTIHIDILDGKFADNNTFLDPKPFSKYTIDTTFELHMMVDNPIQYLKPFAAVGFTRFLGHIEKMPDPEEFIAQGQLLGEVGLAVDSKTNLDHLKTLYDNLDCLLIMTIQAGYSSQAFIPDLLKKVEEARSHTDEFKETSRASFFPIEVDGGINDKTILQAKKAGATRFVTTSFLFNSQNPENSFNILKKLIA